MKLFGPGKEKETDPFFCLTSRPATQLKGADPAGLNRLVYGHAGPNPPVPPLSSEAEALKEEGNALFKAGDFDAARDKYSAALEQAVRFSLEIGLCSREGEFH